MKNDGYQPIENKSGIVKMPPKNPNGENEIDLRCCGNCEDLEDITNIWNDRNDYVIPYGICNNWKLKNLSYEEKLRLNK